MLAIQTTIAAEMTPRTLLWKMGIDEELYRLGQETAEGVVKDV